MRRNSAFEKDEKHCYASRTYAGARESESISLAASQRGQPGTSQIRLSLGTNYFVPQYCLPHTSCSRDFRPDGSEFPLDSDSQPKSWPANALRVDHAVVERSSAQHSKRTLNRIDAVLCYQMALDFNAHWIIDRGAISHFTKTKPSGASEFVFQLLMVPQYKAARGCSTARLLMPPFLPRPLRARLNYFQASQELAALAAVLESRPALNGPAD